jgi:hypothetical protein
MKRPVSPHLVACLILGLIVPLSAQNLVSNHKPSKTSFKSGAVPGDSPRFGNTPAPGSYEVPDMEKVRGEVSDEPPVFTDQDAASLKERPVRSRPSDSLLLDILRKPSPYRRLASNNKRPQRYEVASNSLQNGLALVSAMYREVGKAEKTSDCSTIALTVSQRLKDDAERMLEIVEREVSANPGCACEIVKAAISSTSADSEQVIAIVETAIHAAPDSMRIISQCALAASPESISGVQELLARLDPNAGESAHSAKSAKGAKDAKVASIIAPPQGNPLDRPPNDFPPPPPIFPPPVTDVNP